MQQSTDNETEQLLREAERVKAGQYDKRTEHIDGDGRATFINRLILEDSPYLLQHAHNPVDWYPWGSEAFERAASEGKPVFLSIGYSTCHWCHVMELESFDNVEVGKQLNQHFVSIKMDREQYPDIDEVYMTGVQLMTGHGGWPMSNFLLPDGRPFFGATYFPPHQFLQLLQQITTAWTEQRAELETSAASIHSAIIRLLGTSEAGQNLDPKVFSNCLQVLHQREDRTLGGLAGAPKFPQEPLLLFVLDQAVATRDSNALQLVCRALHAMGRGGICDQVGGGFHRYSVDEQWLVPHFEKMLYNQSQLGHLYSEAFRLTDEPFFERLSRRTFDYVLRDMQKEEGGFYSATDADSEGAEGTFFLWTPGQIEEVLSPEQAELIIQVFNISRTGNFEGANILHLAESLEALRSRHGDDVMTRVDDALEILYTVRESRVHPLRDDKMIVAWSAAMATSLAEAGYAHGQQHWVDAARRAVEVILARNLQPFGELWRIYLNGTVSVPGQLEDYGNLIQALLVLYRGEMNGDYLQHAETLMGRVLDDFLDSESGLFFTGPPVQSGPQLVRSSNASDGATLSAVATVLECLWWLERSSNQLADQHAGLRYRQVREQCLAALAAATNDNPLSHPSVLRIFRLDMQGSFASIQFAAAGAVRIALRKHLAGNQAQVLATISCTKSWHVLAPGNPSQQQSLTPLELSLDGKSTRWRIKDADYPESSTRLHLPGTDSPAAQVYAGELQVTLQLEANADVDAFDSCIGIEIKLQACSDSHCLLPETLYFLV